MPDPRSANPLPTALQPTNVALAEMVDALKELNDAATDAAGAGQKAAGGAFSLGKELSSLSAGIARAGVASAFAFNELTKFTGAISSTVGRFVEAFSPVTVKRFQYAVADLNASIGETLMPVMTRLTLVVRGMADVFASLSPPARNMIATLAAASVGMVVMGGAVGGLSAVINSATAGLPALLGVLAGAATGVGLMSGTFDQFQEVIREVTVVARQVFETLGGVFQQLFAAAQPLIQALIRFASEASGPFLGAIRQMAGSLGDLLAQMVPVVESLLPVLIEVGGAFQQLQAGMLQLAVAVVGPLLQVVAALAPVVQTLLLPLTEGVRLLGTLAGVLGGVLGPALQILITPLTVFGELVGALVDEFRDALGELNGAFAELSAVAGEIGRELSAAFRELFEAARPMIDAFKDDLVSSFRVMTDVIRDVAARLSQFVAVLRDLFGIEAAGAADPTGKSQGKAFRQVSTGSAESMLKKFTENAYGLGSNASPQQQTATNTGKIAGFLERMLNEFPDAIASRLGAVIVERWNQLKKDAVNAPADAANQAWKNTRDTMSRVFG